MDDTVSLGWYNDETGQWDKALPDLPTYVTDAEREAYWAEVQALREELEEVEARG